MDPATTALNWPPTKQRISLVNAKRPSRWAGSLEGGQGEEKARQNVHTGTTIEDPSQKQATEGVARNPNDAYSWLFSPSFPQRDRSSSPINRIKIRHG